MTVIEHMLHPFRDWNSLASRYVQGLSLDGAHSEPHELLVGQKICGHKQKFPWWVCYLLLRAIFEVIGILVVWVCRREFGDSQHD